MNKLVTYADKSTRYFNEADWGLFGDGIMRNLVRNGKATIEDVEDLHNNAFNNKTNNKVALDLLEG